MNNRVENAWAQVEVRLKKRADLIPALVNIVKGYSKYEKRTFKELAEIRTSLKQKESVKNKYNLNKKMGKLLDKVFVIAESYPSLKANENFLKLQEELSEVEEEIAYTRQFYNDTVYKFNNKLQRFPSSIIGNWMRLSKKDSFDAKTDYEGVIF